VGEGNLDLEVMTSQKRNTTYNIALYGLYSVMGTADIEKNENQKMRQKSH
jgi:hypothetical protein